MTSLPARVFIANNTRQLRSLIFDYNYSQYASVYGMLIGLEDKKGFTVEEFQEQGRTMCKYKAMSFETDGSCDYQIPNCFVYDSNYIMVDDCRARDVQLRWTNVDGNSVNQYSVDSSVIKDTRFYKTDADIGRKGFIILDQTKSAEAVEIGPFYQQFLGVLPFLIVDNQGRK